LRSFLSFFTLRDFPNYTILATRTRSSGQPAYTRGFSTGRGLEDSRRSAFLSVQAAYTAPVILMSQNRQAMKDRLEAYNDFQIN